MTLQRMTICLGIALALGLSLTQMPRAILAAPAQVLQHALYLDTQE